MAPFIQSNRTALIIRPETAFGVTDPGNPNWKTLRFTGEGIDLDKKTSRSEVIRADRMNDALTYLGRSTAGDVSGELSYADWDDLMAAALCNTWTAITEAALDVTITAGGDGATWIFTRTAGSFVTDGVVAGVLINWTGFTHAVNNKAFFVKTVTALVVTITELGTVPIAEVGPSASIGYTVNYIKNGVLPLSFEIEKQFLDSAIFAHYSGQIVDSLEIDMTAMQRITLKFNFMGKENAVGSVSAVTGGATVAPTGVLASITASVNVGEVLIDGAAASTGIKAFKMTTSNNLRAQEVVGSATPAGFGLGSFEVKGSTEAYFEDATMWQKVISHADVAQFIRTTDAKGNCYGFNIPRANFTKGSGKVAGINQDVMIPLEWEASRDAPTNSQIIISKVTVSLT